MASPALASCLFLKNGVYDLLSGRPRHETANGIGRSDGKWLDYFSILPEPVIHHILSFLPFNQIVPSCVLSKTWNRIWFNYPNLELYFDEGFYTKRAHILPFSEHVERIMGRCLFRKVYIHSAKLLIYVVSLEEMTPIIDRFLMGAIKKKVFELSVNVGYVNRKIYQVLYCFPGEAVVADSVKVLQLDGCLLDDAFTCVSLPHLRDFKLSHCQFSGENILNKILSGVGVPWCV